MCNSRVWSEKAMEALFKAAKKAFPDKATFAGWEANPKEVFAYDVSENEYEEILQKLFDKVSNKTDKSAPTTPEAVNTFLTIVFGVKPLKTLSNRRWRVKGLAVAYKVGFITLDQYLNINEITINNMAKETS